MTMSQAMHQYAEAKLGKAADILGAARSSIPTPPDYPNFDLALAAIDECRAAIATAWDVDSIAEALRVATGQLAGLCGGPAEASVNAAIDLIDQAIGGESM